MPEGEKKVDTPLLSKLMISGFNTKKDIDLLFKKGKREVLSFGKVFFSLCLSEDKDFRGKPHLRILISARKKLGKAVERNRARRIIKEVFIRFVREVEPEGVLNVAVVLNRLDLNYSEVYNEVVNRLKSYFEKNEISSN
ncbi:MAG: ribonuclease P protein component [Actinobacteria bacterium]|nr:ribonuclease P protein component [Actinomycetota bacterium]